MPKSPEVLTEAFANCRPGRTSGAESAAPATVSDSQVDNRPTDWSVFVKDESAPNEYDRGEHREREQNEHFDLRISGVDRKRESDCEQED